MYLSRVTPAPGFIISQLANKANAGDAYAQHQFLWLLFEQKTERDFLFRYEQGRRGVAYYVLSPTPPKEMAGLAIHCKRFEPRLGRDDVLAYTLRVNPTRKLKGSPDGRGERVDVLMHAKYQARKEGVTPELIAELQLQAAQDWLLDDSRQERLGVRFLNSPEVTEHLQHQVYKGRNRKAQPIQFSSVNYQGLLRVVDPERFVSQLALGIGRSKSMGCGLMLVRRATS